MMSWKYLVLPLICCLAGCPGTPPAPTPAEAIVLPGKASIRLQLDIRAGGYAVQNEVPPYTPASIQHLLVKLFKLSNQTAEPVLDAAGAPIEQDVPQAQFGQEFVFSDLYPDSTYRFYGFAYRAAGTADEDLISPADGSGYLDVTITTADTSALGRLTLQLIDMPFNGMATATGLQVQPGGFAVASESLD